MSQSRDKAIADRTARMEQYIRAGKSIGEMADLEGLDLTNEPRRVCRPAAAAAGLSLSMAANDAVPAGLMEIPRVCRYNLSQKLQELRDRHHYIAISHMTGLTNAEQLRATKNPYTHNWTLGQLQRLAVAIGMNFEELIAYMQKSHIDDFRSKK